MKIDISENPYRIYEYYRLIWQPKYWKIISYNNSETDCYIDPWSKIEIKSDSLFWRLRIYFTKIGVWWTNSLHWLLYTNLWNGN